MGKHTTRNIGIGVVVLVAIGVVALMVIPIGQTTGELNVALAPPLTLVGDSFIPISLPIGEQVVEVGEIFCRIKQSTLVHGVDARLLETIESSGIQGSPFIRLAFVTGTETEVASYNVLPKVFCTQQNNIPIEVFVKEMQLTVRCEDPSGLGACTSGNNITPNQILWSQGVTGSRLLNFGTGQGEQTLVNFYVPMNQVEANFPNQDFTMFMNFEVSGTLVVQYSGFMFEYIIPIFRADIETFDQIDIRKAPAPAPLDADGDKILDRDDACPNEPETYNGFQDADGCPDVPQCTSGSIVITDTQGFFLRCEPVDPEPPTTCESTNDLICSEMECIAMDGAWVEGGTDLSGNPVPPYCDLTTEPSRCPEGEKLVLTTGNVFVCEIDDDLLDNDGDGILNGIDACPNQFGSAEFNGCPTPPPPPVNGGLVLEDEVIKGDIATLTTIRFNDNTIETAVATASGGGIQLPNLSQQISELVPAQLFGTTTTGEGKSIDEIEIEVFYFNNQSPSGAVNVQTSVLNSILTVVESTVSSASSIPIPFTGGIGTGALSPQSGEVSPLGTGISLGKIVVSAENIVDLGEDAGITEGQRRDANLDFEISGFVTFQDADESKRFSLTNTIISFKNFEIDNVADPKPEPNCLDSQIEIINPQTGRVIGCETPDPDTPTCFSSERPQGYACTPQDVVIFCGGDPTNCTEKDGDNDGVPNYRDDCRDQSNPNFREDGLTTNGSDPDDGCRFKEKGVICNPLTQDCKPDGNGNGNGGKFCSVENPEKCPPTPPIDLNTLLILGGIGLIIIAVIVVIVRRR